MTDVLPSCIGMEGLLYLLFSGFVQANKSHEQEQFPLVLLQAKAVREVKNRIEEHIDDKFPISPH